MKHSATCWLLICFHGNSHRLNISPVFPGLVQSPSGAVFDKVCCPPHCGILVSLAGPAGVSQWWLLDHWIHQEKHIQERELPWQFLVSAWGPERGSRERLVSVTWGLKLPC